MSMSLIAIGFVASLAGNVALWLMKSDALAEARAWERLYNDASDAFASYRRNSVRRDPKTGRYMKRGS